jgi:hypothetical protein
VPSGEPTIVTCPDEGNPTGTDLVIFKWPSAEGVADPQLVLTSGSTEGTSCSKIVKIKSHNASFIRPLLLRQVMSSP